MTKLFIFAGIFTVACNLVNIVKAEDIVVVGTESTAYTQTMETIYIPGHTDICSRKDKHILECVRLVKGQKPEVFTVKTK